MKIRRLSATNFRCFKRIELDLSADVVAVYGRNGTGKTAIFDALEFALFGKVSRLADADWALQNLFDSTQASVRVDLGNSNEPWVESVLDPEGVALRGSGNWRNRNEFLYDFLVDPSQFPPRRELAAVHDVYRASLMLSQESLREFIHARPDDRARVLAQLAGSAYSQRCLDKARSVGDEARRAAGREANGRERLHEREVEIKGQLAECKARLSSLEPELLASATFSEVKNRFDRAELAALYPDSPPADLDIFDAELSAHLNEARTRLEETRERLIRLASLATRYAENHAELESLNNRCEGTRAELQSAREAERIADTEVDTLRRRIEELRGRGARIRQWVEQLNEMSELRVRERLEREELRRLEKRAGELKRAVDLNTARCNEAEERLGSLEATASQARERYAMARDRLRRLGGLRAGLEGYDAAVSRQADAVARRRSLDEKNEQMRGRKARTDTVHREALSALAAARAKAEGIRVSVDRMTGLLAQIRETASGSRCPACGHDHGDESALHAAFDAMLEGVPRQLSAAESELAAAEGRARELQERTDAIEAELSESLAEATGVSGDVAREAVEIEMFQAEAAAVGIDTSGAVIEAACGEAQESVANIARELEEAESRLMEGQRTLADCDNVASSLATQQAERATAAQRAVRNLENTERLIAQALEALQEAEVEQDEEGLLERSEEELRDVEQELAAAEASRPILEDTSRARREERRNREKILDSLEDERAGKRAAVDDFDVEAKALDLPRPFEADAFTERRLRVDERLGAISEAARQLGAFVRSRKVEALNEQRALLERDAAEASGALGQIEQRLASLEAAQETVASWASELEGSIDHGVRRTIKAHQLEIERHFRAMIPSSYLFDSVSLKEKNGGVSIGIRYRDQLDDAGEAEYFLSSAQANVLALSIFLSLASKQRWSNLETILLDDPVQHLDDLDAVAFLDTLRALALGRFGKQRQIIVSTCDQNLYLLMCRKLRVLDSMGLRFAGISLVGGGMDGPSVSYDFGEAAAA